MPGTVFTMHFVSNKLQKINDQLPLNLCYLINTNSYTYTLLTVIIMSY